MGVRPLLFSAAVAALLCAAPAQAEPLDRIVAIVNDKPIFLSELRERSRPFLARAAAAGAPTDSLQKELLEQMINERVEADEAEKRSIRVSPAEIDSALKMLAEQMKVGVPELLEEVKKQKLTETEYRAEIARQILDGKLIQLRVRGNVKVTEADAKKRYETWLKEASPIDLRIIVLQLEKGASETTRKAKESLAAQIVTQARGGTDFCSLVQKHSEDTATKTACGSRGPAPRAALASAIEKASASLTPGQIAGPVLFPDASAPEAVLVMQRAPGSSAAAPTFASKKAEMMEQALMEATERERKVWLTGLRRAAVIEVRL